MLCENPHPYRQIKKNIYKETGLRKSAFKSTYKKKKKIMVKPVLLIHEQNRFQICSKQHITIVKTQTTFEWN